MHFQLLFRHSIHPISRLLNSFYQTATAASLLSSHHPRESQPFPLMMYARLLYFLLQKIQTD